MPAPVVAVVGSTGYVGKCCMPVFLEALKNGQLQELRVLTREEKLDSEQIQSYVASGAKAVSVDFTKTPTVTAALQGVDVTVSTLGTGDGIEEVRETLLNALLAAEVKVYFPSEFGTNHYKQNHKHPIFDGKRDHFLQAQKKGLNPIRMLTGDIMESSFGEWFGLNCNTKIWKIVGDGADLQCAMTAERDIGRFTLEALLLANSDITKCPDELEVYSDMKTLREYAKAFDNVSGSEIKIEQIPLADFLEEYNKDNEFVKLLMIMFAEGVHDFTKSTATQLLNPNESIWKYKKIEEYATETGGIPWKDE